MHTEEVPAMRRLTMATRRWLPFLAPGFASALGFLVAAAVLVPGLALAQEPGAPGSDDASAPKVKVERTASGQKIFRITEGIVVEGRVQKPNAFYVLQRSSIDY